MAKAEQDSPERPDNGRDRLRHLLGEHRPGDPPLRFPCSLGQQRLWFLHQLDRQSPFYNVPLAVRVRGQLDESALQRSLDFVVARHETLRTTFATSDGTPVQVIASTGTIPLRKQDVRGGGHSPAAAEIRALLTAEASAPFDLAGGSLTRALLLRTGAREWVLVITFHHIVSDAWSLGVCFRELAAAYKAYAAGATPALPSLAQSFRAFTLWQRGWLASDEARRQLAYWQRRLAGASAELPLPCDDSSGARGKAVVRSPGAATFQGRTLRLRLPAGLVTDIERFSAARKLSPFMTLSTGFQMLLYRYSGLADLTIGVPIANRNRSATEDLIGFFVNTLVLRSGLSRSDTVELMLGRGRDAALEAFANQDLPFERVIDALGAERSSDQSPLFRVMFSVVNAPTPTVELPGVDLALLDCETGAAQFDLALMIRRANDTLAIAFEYRTALFDDETIYRLAAHYENLLRAMILRPGSRVDALPMLSREERTRLTAGAFVTGKDQDPVGTISHSLAKVGVDWPGADGARAVVLDSALEPVPVGVAGNLHIVGPGIAAAHVSDSGRAASCLIPCPWGGRGSRMYATGLRARPLAEGSFQLSDATSGPDALLGLPSATGGAPLLREETAGGHGEIEQLLAAVWAEVLDIAPPGVDDNFFELGGDSVSMMRVVARALRRGVVISVAQFLDNQTIALLARVAARDGQLRSSARPAASVGDGPVPLTPIQRWFFAGHPDGPAFWNQSLLLRCPVDVDSPALEAALQAVIENHDAFRLAFRREEGVWSQRSAHPAPLQLQIVVVDDSSSSEDGSDFMRACVALQRGMDLDSPPLMRAGLFRRAGRPDVLLLSAHHLIVDALSWSVLLDDLEQAYAQRVASAAPSLAQPRTTFRHWSEELGAATTAATALDHAQYWHTTVAAGHVAIPDDRPADERDAPDLEASTERVDVELSVHETRAILASGGGGPLQPADVLLAALEAGVTEWCGQRDVLADVESHGREALVHGADLSRTVGWFTAIWPLRLVARRDISALERVRDVASRRQAAPRAGVGWGLLQFGESRLDPGLAHVRPSVSFNYLGRLDGHIASGAAFSPLGAPPGPTRDPAAARDHHLQIEAAIVGERLCVALLYGRERHSRKTIERLAARMHRFMTSELADARKVGDAAKTTGTGDAFPLSPMQEGMLFECLSSPDANPYVVQFACTLRGQVDRDRLIDVWNELAARHEALRTQLVWKGVSRPAQIIRSDVTVPVVDVDYRALSGEAQSRALDKLLARDHKRGFDLTSAPLMRVLLVRLADDVNRLVWTHHHILFDGWSLQILFRELLERYAGRPLRPREGDVRRYVAWLRGRNNTADEPFWRKYLAGIGAAPVLPGAPLSRRPRSEHTVELGLSAAEVGAVRERARTLQVTIGAALQAAWAAALAALTGRKEVVFGLTVSGRPPEIPDVESAVGLFINTVPVRARIEDGVTLGELAVHLHRDALVRTPHEHAALVDVRRWAGMPGPQTLFDALLIIDNYPVASAKPPGAPFTLSNFALVSPASYPVAGIARLLDEGRLSVLFDEQMLPVSQARLLLEAWRAAVIALAGAPERRVAQAPDDTVAAGQH